MTSDRPPAELQRLSDAAQFALASVPGARTPLLIVDRAALQQQVARWRRHLPQVTPFYAVKANSCRPVLETLRDTGIGFDAATGGELTLLRELAVDATQVIATHPIRDGTDLAETRTFRPLALVVQDARELDKLAAAGIPGPEYAPFLLVRVALPFSNLNKFGVRALQPELRGSRPTWRIDVNAVAEVLEHARMLGGRLGAHFRGFGLAGHVGTNNTDVGHWRVMLALFRLLHEQLADRGLAITMVDLGGGYCDQAAAAATGTTQDRVLAELGGAVGEFADHCPDVRLVAEPGRFLVADAAALVTTVKSVQRLGWRTAPDGSHVECDHLEVHIDDGIYGCLMGQEHDDKVWQFHRLPQSGNAGGGPRLPAHIWGATCDSYDRLEGWRALPLDLAVGDRLLVPGAGAYSLATRTRFNAAAAPWTWCFDSGASSPFSGVLLDDRGIETKV